MRLPAVVLLAVFLLLVGAAPACTVNQLVGDLALLTDGGDGDDGGVDSDDDGGVEDEDAGPGDAGASDGGPRDGGDYLTGFPFRAR